MTGVVYFIGAGPGDPELITIKGRDILARADVILYAGSLVSHDVLKYAAESASFYNTAGMVLERQVAVMVEAVRQDKLVARLHTGDPSVFGAIHEQIASLEAEGILYRIIPGVSSAFAAAAALGVEYTLPEVTQTVIFTRQSGRTPVPPSENLRGLAAHHSSLVIFLSTGLISEVMSELINAGYDPETPVALVYRASWPDERIIRGTLSNIVNQVEKEELTHQGLIVVSPVLKPDTSTKSHLYGSFQQNLPQRQGIALLTLTGPAVRLGRMLLNNLAGSTLYLPERLCVPQDEGRPEICPFKESIRQVLQRAFMQHEALICIMASGIVVRELSPLLENKHSDPAVVVMDVEGHFAVSLLSGHEGGANQLTRRVAEITGGQAVITTASDSKDIPALDILAKERRWKMSAGSKLSKIMAALINDRPVALVVDERMTLPSQISGYAWKARYTCWEEAVSSGYRHLVVFTCKQLPSVFWEIAPDSVVYHLPQLVVGVGCNKNTPQQEIITAIQRTLDEAELSSESVLGCASIVDKAGEPGLIEASRFYDWELLVFDREQIRLVKNIPNPSEYAMKVLGVPGVAEPAALLASNGGVLLVEKKKYPNVTVAIAYKEET